VRLNGSMASVGDLAEAVGESIDLCGQHEHQQLTKPASHLRMLDDWIGAALEPAFQAYRAAWTDAVQARKRHDELLQAGEADSARIDEARDVLGRIEAVNPQPGEYDELLDEVRRMENIEDLARGASSALEAVSGEGGALDSLNSAIASLQMAARIDTRLANEVQSLNDACYILEDASRSIDAAVPDLDSFDPARLEELQNRLASFQGLMRNYGPTMEKVLARRDAAAAVLDTYANIDEALGKSERELRAAEKALAAAAESLSGVRAESAPRFAREVNGVLAELEMAGCAISCEIARLPRERWTTAGPDQIAFMFRPTRDSEPRPLARIASGGELSRVTLAVKTVLGRTDAAETLVFDEVDAGVGGKAALAVGGVLRQLAESHQVIVVTHLPQIAVLADAHFVVERAGKVSPETNLREVTGSARVEEIARMLSGTIDSASLAHAAEMLDLAHR
ncbi:MAG: DNA repair protein RecN, partial [Eggerthellaceae bacterium]|nr:DNA repair protein RecN [Eggerthellaceae bacterium]